MPAPPGPGGVRAVPALRPAGLPRVPAAGRGRRPVRGLRARAGQDGPFDAHRVRRQRHRHPGGLLRAHRALRAGLRAPDGRARGSPATSRSCRSSATASRGGSSPRRSRTGRVTHILFNMLALWMVGAQYLERLLGAARYAAVYLVSALGGSVCYLLMSFPPRTPNRPATASGCRARSARPGAVFGLFGALLVLQPALGRSSAGMYVTIGLNAVIGFVVPTSPGRPTSAACSPAPRWRPSSPSPAPRSAGPCSGRRSPGCSPCSSRWPLVKYALTPGLGAVTEGSAGPRIGMTPGVRIRRITPV